MGVRSPGHLWRDKWNTLDLLIAWVLDTLHPTQRDTRGFWVLSSRKSDTFFVGTPLCPYSYSYCGTYGIFDSVLIKKALLKSAVWIEWCREGPRQKRRFAKMATMHEG